VIPLDFSLDRTVEIRASRATVFRFFTDSARWARWWGAGSTVEPRVGGAVLIVYPTGDRASGVVTELVPDERFAFTFGYEAAGKPIPPGGSLVTITLADAGGATRLVLRHDVATAATRDEHVQGWRYQLARFADVATADAFGAIAEPLAAWVAAWNEPDADARRALFERCTIDTVRFRDANGDLYGRDELAGHVGAIHRFMPGMRLEARGTPRRGHDVALADWAIVAADGTARMTGTNVVRFDVDGRIADVVGIPNVTGPS
jgi:uncharacterized protein YndB with AHSA1/START domain